jgi:hypothetical protein
MYIRFVQEAETLVVGEEGGTEDDKKKALKARMAALSGGQGIPTM